MIKELKIVLRGIRNDKTLSLLKLAGLVLAFCVTIPLICSITFDKSFDRFHSDSERIYNVYIDETYRGTKDIYGECPPAIGEYLRDLFPEVENMVRTKDRTDVLISKDNNNTFKEKVLWTDPSFIDVFHLELVTGSRVLFLDQPNETYIAESLSVKLFGSLNPAGKNINIDGKNYSVSGVFKDYPFNSHQKFTVLLPLKNCIPKDKYSWESYEYLTYVKFKKGIDTKGFENRIQLLITNYLTPWLKSNHNIDYVFDSKNSMKLRILPVTDIHLQGSFISSFEKESNISTIFVCLIIILVLLFTAYFNLMGFAFSKGKRYQFQLNVKRCLGISKKKIISSFILENVTYTIVAFIMGVGFTLMVFRLKFSILYDLTKISLTTYFLPIAGLFLFSILISVIGGIILGIYFNQVILKSKLKVTNFSSLWLNRAIPVAQVAASIILLVSIIAIYKQLNYMSTFKLGIDVKNIVVINQGSKIKNYYETFKNELKKSPLIKEVSCSNSYPFNWMSTESYAHANSTDQTPYPFQYFSVDVGFQGVFNYKILEGRWFSTEFKSDERTIILNEAAVKVMRLKKPVGEEFYKSFAPSQKFQVIAVVGDFNFRSLHHKVEPLILYPLKENDWWRYIEIKGKTPDRVKLLTEIQQVWNKVSGNEYLNYSFLEDKMTFLYEKEMKAKLLIGIFSFIAILISCFGLLGTVLNTTNEKIKEIGIRKVNGARIFEVMALLNKDFVKWVVIAFIIACPIAWYAMHKWLQNFAYKTELSWWVFALAGLIALGIALITVSWQSWRAATRNPVEALRYE